MLHHNVHANSNMGNSRRVVNERGEFMVLSVDTVRAPSRRSFYTNAGSGHTWAVSSSTRARFLLTIGFSPQALGLSVSVYLRPLRH